MSDKPFIVVDARALQALPLWLKERGCNTYSFSRSNIIHVGHDTKPDSDWGGKYTPRGYIILKDKQMFDATVGAIRKAYGWEPV